MKSVLFSATRFLTIFISKSFLIKNAPEENVVSLLQIEGSRTFVTLPFSAISSTVPSVCISQFLLFFVYIKVMSASFAREIRVALYS